MTKDEQATILLSSVARLQRIKFPAATVEELLQISSELMPVIDGIGGVYNELKEEALKEAKRKKKEA